LSEGDSTAITVAEKFFGFLLVIIGALSVYYSLTSGDALLSFTTFFAVLGLMLLVVGIIMLIAKTE
jgi:hypothetical protein